MLQRLTCGIIAQRFVESWVSQGLVQFRIRYQLPVYAVVDAAQVRTKFEFLEQAAHKCSGLPHCYIKTEVEEVLLLERTRYIDV